MKRLKIIAVIILCLTLSACSAPFEKVFYIFTADIVGEENLYENICTLIEEDKTEFTFKDVSEEVLADTWTSVIKDHPEYFWFSLGYKYTTITQYGMEKIELKPRVSTELLQYKEAVDEKVDSILDKANQKQSDYEKVLFIHDYIIDNTVYDTKTADLITADKESNTIYNASTIYGCLVEKKAVCSGYAAAFHLLTKKLGFESGRTRGEADGELHEWNYIKLDNEYYFIDVTWDDPLVENSAENRKSYDYFLITQDELFETHKLEEGEKAPECKGTKYNYYVYNGIYLQKYTYKDYRNIYKAKNQRSLTVKFANKTECDKALRDLITKKRIFNIINVDSINYFVGPNNKTLTIYY